MKIWLVGNTSKIAQVIEKSVIVKKYRVSKISQRNTNFFAEIEPKDAIIYLISDSRTIINKDEYLKYIYSNCILLAKFIILNEIDNKNFIYFSTAKVYNIFDNKLIYNENDDITKIPTYKHLKEIAKDIIKLIKDKPNCDHKDKKVEEIINKLLELPKIKTYFPIYEYTKVISELIIQELLNGAYILRPSYLYGDNEKRNIIYQLIEKASTGKKIQLSSCEKDFVHYNTLLVVLQKIIQNKINKIAIINISNSKNINNDKLIYFIDEINSIVNKKSNIEIVKKCNKSFIIDNSKMKAMMGKKYIEDIEKNIRFIIYRYYIQEIQKLQLLNEFIGGSFACSYLVENDKKQKYILKICIGNGAENGNLKMIKEAKQMKALYEMLKNKNLKIQVPEIYEIITCNEWTIIKEEYIDGKTYTDIFYENNNINYLCDLICEYCKLICSIYNMERIDKKVDMLKQSEERICLRLLKVKRYDNNVDIFKNYKDFTTIQINNRTYQNPLTVLNKIREKNIKFENMLGLCISGDSILDNIIVKNDRLYILDSRGEDLTWEDNKPYFDPYYDLGKILFYFIGWSTIRTEKFYIKTNNYNLKDAKSYIKLNNDVQKVFNLIKYKCLNIFLECKRQLNINEDNNTFIIKIILMSGTHFLSDTYPRIVGKGENPVDECYAEFLIGTILINNIYDYIENNITIDQILEIGE